MERIIDRLNNTQAYRDLYADTRDKKIIAAFGVQPNEKPFIAANAPFPVLYVCSDYVEAQRIFRAVSGLGRHAVFVPHKEDVLLYKRSSSRNTVFARNAALHELQDGFDVAVTCIDALMQLLPERKVFVDASFELRQGVCYDVKRVANRLVAVGYRRVDGISAEGEFTLRGDILDISMPFGKRYRVDFFDDEVESISVVSSEGVATGKTECFAVYPLFDTIGLPSSKMDKIRSLASSKLSADAKSRLDEIVSELTASGGGGRVDSAWLAPFLSHSTLFDYLPSDAVVLWDEPKLLKTRTDFLYKEHAQRVANLVGAGEILPLHHNSLINPAEVYAVDTKQIALQTLPYQSVIQPQAIHNFKTGALPTYIASDDELLTDARTARGRGYELVLLVSGDDIPMIAERFSSGGIYVADIPKLSAELADGLVLPLPLERGFISHTNKLFVIGARDLGRSVNGKAISKSKKQAFLSVEKGDYVVHEIHGIGLCEGIQKIKTGDAERDYIVVLYKNGDRLYVPVDASDMLSRYSGGENPTLSKIGGEDFARVKSKVKTGIREMSVNLLKLYAEREKARGFTYCVDKYLGEEFSQYFPYKPTADQLKCVQEITADLTTDKIMDRVLVGDVGFGKTEVAMRAAFDVVSNGYQVAVLAPTTILAEQHYNTFKERMGHFDIEVACLNRFRTPEQQKEIVGKIKDGTVNIIVGTHRLLSADVQFSKLGLLILDEEQRFGVEHKEKIKTLKTTVDVLTLSATPIPRTLHMALSGIRDISTITTPPVERMAVETFVVEESSALLTDVISRELGRGGQVYCVYNKVQTIDAFAAKLATLVPEAKIIVAHGQMGETALEDAVVAFSQGKGNLLVCTTIIENGIDIPNANTIIVVDADKMGLSQLYQLRGRVGRSNRLAYAYFLYKKDKILSDVAYKRLSSITEYSELGSGFKIAMKDLEIRGTGNILGREQHGHMMKVGYETYARLLKETVAELKGEKPEQKLYTDVEIDIEAYAPESYIPRQKDRMDFYQQLAACKTVEEIASLNKQIADVYGALPVTVANLFTVAEIKTLANAAGISRVSVKVGKGELTFANKQSMMNKRVFEALDDDRLTPLSGSYGVQFVSNDFLQKDRLLSAMTDFLRKIQPSPHGDAVE